MQNSFLSPQSLWFTFYYIWKEVMRATVRHSSQFQFAVVYSFIWFSLHISSRNSIQHSGSASDTIWIIMSTSSWLFAVFILKCFEPAFEQNKNTVKLNSELYKANLTKVWRGEMGSIWESGLSRRAAKTWGYSGCRQIRIMSYIHTQTKNVRGIKPLKHTLKGTSQNSIELEREFTTDKHATEWSFSAGRSHYCSKELTRNVLSLLLGTTKDLLSITEAGFSIR